MKKTLIIFVIVIILFSFSCYSYAAFSFDEIFDRGNNFNGVTTENANLTGLEDVVKQFGTDLIKPVGYLIFAIVTVILGAKYIWSGVEGKSKLKETLPAFVVAVIFFYLAANVVTFFQDTFSSAGMDNIDNIDTVTNNIWANVSNVVQIVAFGGIVAVGIKYMFESSDGKAKLKERLFPLIVGMIFVFCAAGVVDYIITAADKVV